MSRAVAATSVVLGAGFSTLATVITDLSVYDGTFPLISVAPLAVGLLAANLVYPHDDDRDELPDGLDREAIKELGGDPDA
ncbi:hypothetical protein [Halobellus inordinatus]|uniref:hypothetical protein n=1 Tax=Halobellus inordinatus TaxID=1126236 RepID=UPI002114D1FD|nr:hypothetical protein [Halobellus ramosii]